MNYETGWFSLADTDEGAKQLTVNFEPKGVRFHVTNRTNAGTVNTYKKSEGVTDGTNQWCQSGLAKEDKFYTEDYTDRVVHAFQYPSGSLATGLRIDFDNFQNLGGGTWAINLDVVEVMSGTTWQVFTEILG